MFRTKSSWWTTAARTALRGFLTRPRSPYQRCVHSQITGPHGFGRAIIYGLEHMRGDAVVIMMADESDDSRDVVRYWNALNEGYDAVFGSRFIKGGGVIDYPVFKLFLNRLFNRHDPVPVPHQVERHHQRL